MSYCRSQFYYDCNSSLSALRSQLRHQYHSSQEEVNRLQREVVMLKEQLEKRDKTIAELNCDNDALSESLAKR